MFFLMTCHSKVQLTVLDKTCFVLAYHISDPLLAVNFLKLVFKLGFANWKVFCYSVHDTIYYFFIAFASILWNELYKCQKHFSRPVVEHIQYVNMFFSKLLTFSWRLYLVFPDCLNSFLLMIHLKSLIFQIIF